MAPVKGSYEVLSWGSGVVGCPGPALANTMSNVFGLTNPGGVAVVDFKLASVNEMNTGKLVSVPTIRELLRVIFWRYWY